MKERGGWTKWTRSASARHRKRREEREEREIGKRGGREEGGRDPTPCTLRSTPYTLHPTPYALHLMPYTLHPTPYALHPTHLPLHPRDRPLRRPGDRNDKHWTQRDSSALWGLHCGRHTFSKRLCPKMNNDNNYKNDKTNDNDKHWATLRKTHIFKTSMP